MCLEVAGAAPGKIGHQHEILNICPARDPGLEPGVRHAKLPILKICPDLGLNPGGRADLKIKAPGERTSHYFICEVPYDFGHKITSFCPISMLFFSKESQQNGLYCHVVPITEFPSKNVQKSRRKFFYRTRPVPGKRSIFYKKILVTPCTRTRLSVVKISHPAGHVRLS